MSHGTNGSRPSPPAGGVARRRAFTLIEMLVVIAILLIMMALLLPAVQKVREGASRLRCQNNLKQLGLATNQHLSERNCFPPGGWNGSSTADLKTAYRLGLTPTQATTTSHSYLVFLLPYLEQQNLAKQYDYSLSWNAGGNTSVSGTRLPVFMCPSVPQGDDRTLPQSGFPQGISPTDYAPDHGYDDSLVPGLVPANPKIPSGKMIGCGIMAPNTCLRAQDVGDGLSTTLLISEDAGRPQSWTNRIRNSLTGGSNGAGWADPGNVYHTGNQGPSAACHTNCSNDNEVYAFHPAGANHVFADGSVRMIRPSMPIALFCALLSANGGESVSSD